MGQAPSINEYSGATVILLEGTWRDAGKLAADRLHFERGHANVIPDNLLDHVDLGSLNERIYIIVDVPDNEQGTQGLPVRLQLPLVTGGDPVPSHVQALHEAIFRFGHEAITGRPTRRLAAPNVHLCSVRFFTHQAFRPNRKMPEMFLVDRNDDEGVPINPSAPILSAETGLYTDYVASAAPSPAPTTFSVDWHSSRSAFSVTPAPESETHGNHDSAGDSTAHATPILVPASPQTPIPAHDLSLELDEGRTSESGDVEHYDDGGHSRGREKRKARTDVARSVRRKIQAGDDDLGEAGQEFDAGRAASDDRPDVIARDTVPSVQDDGSCGDRALSEERGGPSGHQHARDRVRAGSEDPSEALSRLSISLAGLATFDPDEEDRDPITVAVFDRIQALSEELVLWIPESEDRACFKAHCSNFAIWLPDHSTGHARLSYKSTQHPSRKGRAGFMRDMPRDHTPAWPGAQAMWREYRDLFRMICPHLALLDHQ